jgi:peroxiredoxin
MTKEKSIHAEWLLVMALMVLPVGAATEAEADAITQEYDRLQRLWLSEMRTAPDVKSQDLIIKKRPNPADFGAKLKKLLNRDLAHDWTLKYGAWLLENDPSLKTESQRALLNAVEKHHMLSPLVGRFCIAMVQLDPHGELPGPGEVPLKSRGMKMVEKIKTTNSNAEVQGQAALALAMMLGSLGDDYRIMEQQRKHLTEAIIKSAHVKLGEITVADIVRDELYKIKNLSKGRVAPEIAGTDSAGRPMQLKDFRGKVLMLVFWSSWDLEAARSLEILRKIMNSKVAKPFVVLGVNRDSLMNLRALEADRLVTWRNFSDPQQKIVKDYRVSGWPYCMVLGKDGVIHYRGSVGSFADAVANDLLLSKEKTAP